MPIIYHFFGENFKIPHIEESQTLKLYFGGDIQKFSSKLPGFSWPKYLNKKHIPGYAYLGPGTRLDIGLNENNIPKPGDEPINEIDRLTYIHDLAYQYSDDINERHRADQEMINRLKQLKNLSIPQRLIRALIIKLFRAKIKLGQSLPRASKQKAINSLYSNEKNKADIKTKYELVSTGVDSVIRLDKRRLATELHKPFKKPPQYLKVSFRSKDNIWNADLIIVSKPDAGYKYILTVLDGYT